MTALEFNERLGALLGEVTDQEMTFTEQAQFVGFAEYTIFAWKLALAQSIARRNEGAQPKSDDHFSA